MRSALWLNKSIYAVIVCLLVITACSSQDEAPVSFSQLDDLEQNSTKSKQQAITIVTSSKEKLPKEPVKIEIKDDKPTLPASLSNKYPTQKQIEKPKPVMNTITPAPKTIRKYNIALLLPLSGKAAEIGKSLLDATELALFDLKQPALTIKTFDTKGTEEGAKKAVNDAILNDIDIIVGPLFSKTTHAISEIARNNEIDILSFSNDTSLTKDGVLVFGYIPQAQIKRVIDFAIDNKIYRYSALLPKNAYGILMEKTILKELDKHDITPKHIQWYESADETLSKSIKKIATLPEDVTDEAMHNNSEILFIPESSTILEPIINRLSSKNLDTKRLRFAGISQWADKKEIYNNNKLIGSWFAAPSIEDKTNFNNVFEGNYNYKPTAISSLAYEALSLITLAIEDKPEKINLKKFTKDSKFEAISGIFSFDDNGAINRQLNIYQIDESGFKKVD